MYKQYTTEWFIIIHLKILDPKFPFSDIDICNERNSNHAWLTGKYEYNWGLFI